MNRQQQELCRWIETSVTHAFPADGYLKSVFVSKSQRSAQTLQSSAANIDASLEMLVTRVNSNGGAGEDYKVQQLSRAVESITSYLTSVYSGETMYTRG